MGEREEQFKFLKELTAVECMHYIYRKERIFGIFGRVPKFYERRVRQFGENGDPIQGIDLGPVKHLSQSNLKEITDDFSETNFIQRTLSGRLFKGVIREGSAIREVMVKTWDLKLPPSVRHAGYPSALADELLLLTDEDVASHLVKLFGYSCQDDLAVVYDLKLTNTLKDLIPLDEFSWDQRIKMAIDIADALKVLHDKQIAFGSLSASNIFVIFVDDVGEELKIKTIKLFDYDSHQHLENENENDTIDLKVANTDIRYNSPEINNAYGGGRWIKKHAFASDVYVYGLLLLELITKMTGDGFFVGTKFVKSVEEAHHNTCSSVEQDFLDLGMKCVDEDYEHRPNINDVVTQLKNLYSRKIKYRSISSKM